MEVSFSGGETLKRGSIRVKDSKLYLFSFFFLFLSYFIFLIIIFDLEIGVSMMSHICHMLQSQLHNHVSHKII